jgi:hypothetical protein
MNEEPKVELPKPPEGHRWEYRGMGWKPGYRTHYAYWEAGMGETPSRGFAVTPTGNIGHYWEAVPDENPLPPLPDENLHTSVAAQIKADYVTKLERENAELREWKRQQIEEALKLNIQSVGAELGMKAGTPIAENILPAIRKLKAKLAALKSPCVTEDRYEGMSLGEALAAHRSSEPDHTEGGKYRMLEEGEVLRAGDAYLERGEWVGVRHCVGDRLVLAPGQYWRRPVETRENFAQQAKVILQKKFGNKPHRGDPFIDTELNDFVDLIIKASKQ